VSTILSRRERGRYRIRFARMSVGRRCRFIVHRRERRRSQTLEALSLIFRNLSSLRVDLTSCRRRAKEWPLFADIVEKLEFPRRLQLRRPLAASMEISLGAQRSDRSFCVRPSLSPCCGKRLWRQRFPRGSGIFPAPQFPTFSTISARSGHGDKGEDALREWNERRTIRHGRPRLPCSIPFCHGPDRLPRLFAAGLLSPGAVSGQVRAGARQERLKAVAPQKGGPTYGG
jgi:hypothetical protein